MILRLSGSFGGAACPSCGAGELVFLPSKMADTSCGSIRFED